MKSSAARNDMDVTVGGGDCDKEDEDEGNGVEAVAEDRVDVWDDGERLSVSTLSFANFGCPNLINLFSMVE